MMLRYLFTISSLYLTACTSHTPLPSPETRTRNASHLAMDAGWHELTIPTSVFVFKTYGTPIKTKTKQLRFVDHLSSAKHQDLCRKQTLTIYLEGDGFAWHTVDTPSNNPTPITPTGLQMALHDKENYPIAYLARPCQFVFNTDWVGCQSAYWTQLRFSPKVINTSNQAIDYLKEYYHAQHIQLIGYSGGGTLAALIAATRTDVMQLITVAAVLDINQWTRQKNLTPLSGSINPADEWKRLASIPQIHWIGAKDTVVPTEVAYSFVKRFPENQKPQIKVVPSFDHVCCWATQELT